MISHPRGKINIRSQKPSQKSDYDSNSHIQFTRLMVDLPAHLIMELLTVIILLMIQAIKTLILFLQTPKILNCMVILSIVVLLATMTATTAILILPCLIMLSFRYLKTLSLLIT